MFQLTEEEWEAVALFREGQNKPSHGGRRSLPHVFTREGIAMLSGVLQTKHAAQMNVAIMRTFVQLQQVVNKTQYLSERLDRLETDVQTQLKQLHKGMSRLMQLKSSTEAEYFEIYTDSIEPSKTNQQMVATPVSPLSKNPQPEIQKKPFIDRTIQRVKFIQEKVAEYYSLSLADLMRARRTQNIALPRQIAMYLVRKRTQLGFKQIGFYFGGKDPTTVLHAYHTITRKVGSDPEFRFAVDEIEERIEQEEKI